MARTANVTAGGATDDASTQGMKVHPSRYDRKIAHGRHNRRTRHWRRGIAGYHVSYG
jgi:hypothetical protein